MTENKLNLSCCGTNCAVCSFYGGMCAGCNECEGKVFHAPKGSACRIYECSVQKNGYENCKDCAKLPCDIWKATKDPSMSDEEFENSIRERINNLKGSMN